MAGIAVAPLVRLCIALRFRTNLWATYVLLPSRMDSLFLGLLCAYWVREPAIWNWIVKRRKFLWLAFFVLIAGMPALNSEGIPFTFLWISAGYGWMSFFFATVLLLVLTDRQSLFNRIMRWRCLTEFGTISYGVYLFHVGIYSFCLWKLTGHGWPPRSLKDCGASLLAFAITIVSAELSWRYLEKPMVRWGHKWLY
jgi:peptidoglycan/LPS O-acetylase OafA/YrhL